MRSYVLKFHAVLPALQLVEVGIMQGMQVQFKVKKAHLHRFLRRAYSRPDALDQDWNENLDYII